MQQPQAGAMRHVESQTEVVTSKKLQELVAQIDSREKLDEDVEEVWRNAFATTDLPHPLSLQLLVQIADDFIDSVATFACQLAKHRKSDTLEVKDVALHLERNWNIKIPGFSTDGEVKPFKKPTVTDVHKQRIALIKKTAQASNARTKK